MVPVTVVDIVPVAVVEIVPAFVVEIVPLFAATVTDRKRANTVAQDIVFKVLILLSWCLQRQGAGRLGGNSLRSIFLRADQTFLRPSVLMLDSRDVPELQDGCELALNVEIVKLIAA